LAQKHQDMVIFEIPYDIQTVAPITPSDIEREAFKVIYLRDDIMISDVQALINKADEAPDTRMIRAKFQLGEKSYIFDSRGVGVSSSGEAVRIDFRKLGEIIGR